MLNRPLTSLSILGLVLLGACPDDSHVQRDVLVGDTAGDAAPEAVDALDAVDAVDEADPDDTDDAADAADGADAADTADAPPVVTIASVLPETVKVCAAEGTSDVVVIDGTGFPADKSQIAVTWAEGRVTLSVDLVARSATRLFCHIPVAALSETGAYPIVVTTAEGRATSDAALRLMDDQGPGCTPASTYGSGLLCRAYRLAPGATTMPVLVGPDGCGAPRDPELDSSGACPATTLTMPDFALEQAVATPTIPGSPALAGDYALRCVGRLAIPEPGSWQLTLCASDGALVWLAPSLDQSGALAKDDAVVRNDGTHGVTCKWNSPSVVLDDGLQDIVVDYFKRGSGSMGLQLLWRLEPDASSEVVPWLYFVPPPELVAPP